MRTQDIDKLIDFIVSAGKTLVSKSGNIKDIGTKKQFLTEEDIRIERGIKAIVEAMPGKHSFFAEEENDMFSKSDSLWIADPISGTQTFIEGKPNFANVISHMQKGKVDFAAVYNPSADKLYMASEQDGVTLNGKALAAKRQPCKKRIICALSLDARIKHKWTDEQVRELGKELEKHYQVFPYQGSYAYNYCAVAEGLFDGVVSLTNDAFGEFAGCYIANKAGYIATNLNGDKNISHTDRIFVCGNDENYDDLLTIVRGIMSA